MIVLVKGPVDKATQQRLTGWLVDSVPGTTAAFVDGTVRGVRALAEAVGEDRAHSETKVEIECTQKTFVKLRTQSFWR